MKKSVGVLSGLAVLAALTSAGTWYTGKQLPDALKASIAQSNEQAQKALLGTGASASVELVSLEQHFYTSTAHYRVKVANLDAGDESVSLELNFVDRIEHGPLPWSRLKAFKLMPVMATSNYALEKTEGTAKWFAAAKEVAPLQGQVSLGYDRSVQGSMKLLPLDVTGNDGSVVKFSGFNLDVDSSADAEKVKVNGTMGSLAMSLVSPDTAPVKIDLNGMNITGDLTKTTYGFYVGQVDFGLASSQFVFGDQQSTLLLKALEQRNDYRAEGDKMSGRLTYKVGDISYEGKSVGSAQMVMSVKSLDIPALQSLMSWYESHLPEIQQAAAEGRSMPQLAMSPEEEAKVREDILKMLAAKPQVALEDLSFKTANGESRFSLAVELNKPTSLELPPDQLGRQLISQLKSNLTLSKPMIVDLAVLQAAFQGETDTQAIAQQASMTSEMVGQMALQTQLAKLQGSDVVANLNYVDGQVEFNGQKMTLEEFAGLVMANLGAMGQIGG